MPSLWLYAWIARVVAVAVSPVQATPTRRPSRSSTGPWWLLVTVTLRSGASLTGMVTVVVSNRRWPSPYR